MMLPTCGKGFLSIQPQPSPLPIPPPTKFGISHLTTKHHPNLKPPIPSLPIHQFPSPSPTAHSSCHAHLPCVQATRKHTRKKKDVDRNSSILAIVDQTPVHLNLGNLFAAPAPAGDADDGGRGDGEGVFQPCRSFSYLFPPLLFSRSAASQWEIGCCHSDCGACSCRRVG